MTPADASRELIRRDGLPEYARQAWHLVEPGKPLVWNWHYDRICLELMRITYQVLAGVPTDSDAFVCNIPPGTGKSIFFCVMWPTWVWTIARGARFMYFSHDDGLALRDSRKSTELMSSAWYRDRWGYPLKSGRPAAKYHETSAQGFRYSSGLRGGLIGRHAHFLVGDDPVKPIDALGYGMVDGAALDQAERFFQHTLPTRKIDQRTAKIILIQQRIHERDPAQVLLDKGAEALILPMRYDAAVARGDPRTVAGELLFPARFPEWAVARLEARLGIHSPAQLQQSPVPATGGMFSRIDHWTALPREPDAGVLSWDLTFKRAEGTDRVAGGCILKAGGYYYLAAENVAQRSFSESVAAIKAFTVEWPGHPTIIEDKANGSAAEDVLRYSVAPILIEPRGGKLVRANACDGLFRSGRFLVPPMDFAPWVAEFVGELRKFPRGRHDDRVDMTTQGILYLQGESLDTYATVIAALKRGDLDDR